MDNDILLREMRAIRAEMNQGFRDSSIKFDKGLERVHERISYTEKETKQDFKLINNNIHEIDKRTSNIKTKISLYLSVAFTAIVVFKDKISGLLGH